MRKLKLPMVLSLVIAVATLSLPFGTYFFGLLPNPARAQVESRSAIVRSMATHLVASLEKNDEATIDRIIETMVSGRTNILSIGLRSANGQLQHSSQKHEVRWAEGSPNDANSTHIEIPFEDRNGPRGGIEVTFTPLAGLSAIFGIPHYLIQFSMVLFFGCLLFAGATITRALKVVDPTDVVPERVQRAFDTLSEGAVIVDPEARILMSNASFCDAVGLESEELLGSTLSSLTWNTDYGESHGLPWEAVATSRISLLDMAITMTNLHGDEYSYSVNASPILDAQSAVQGVIVTFDDVTETQRINSELNRLIGELKVQEEALNDKNAELFRLATRDPMTDCFNRRSLFDQFDKAIECARSQGSQLHCMMSDLDHFKSVNDTYGHAVGDDVIIMKAKALQDAIGDNGFVGRYGGEEFCTVLLGVSEREAADIASNVLQSVEKMSRNISVLEKPVTTSIGLARLDGRDWSADQWIERADEALYAAKEAGRNRMFEWSDEISKAAGNNRAA